jgi:hypothetical protein
MQNINTQFSQTSSQFLQCSEKMWEPSQSVSFDGTFQASQSFQLSQLSQVQVPKATVQTKITAYFQRI